jgi:hypothetical protein
MEQFFDQYLRYEPGLSWQMVLLTMLISFVLCQLIAAVYSWTFRGLSYSRGFVISLALTGVVATLLMLAIGNNVARGLGLLGTLAIIRFRSTLRDVRDMMFVFAPFASRRMYDGLLRLNTPADPYADEMLKTVLREHCSTFVLVNLREIAQGGRLEQAYQIKLRDPSYRDHLIEALRTIEDLSDVSLLMQDPSLEV